MRRATSPRRCRRRPISGCGSVRAWINGTVREDLIYYQKYASERSANGIFRVNWLIPFNRLTLNPGVSYLATRARPGFEIDTRAQRTEINYNGLIELRVASKTFLGVRGDRRITDFDEDARYLGTNLQDELNRTVTTVAVTFRHQATPLTSITFDVSRRTGSLRVFARPRHRFDLHITGGVKFDPAALIRGAATSAIATSNRYPWTVPGYQGTTAAVDLSYVALGTTRFTVTALRDVQYSFDINQPYYLQTGVTASIDQQLFGPVDIVGRIGAQSLDYRTRAGAAAPTDRVDHIRIYGVGIGYHLGRDMRVGFNVDQQKRTSPLDAREYQGLVYGFAVTYGS